MRMGRGEDDAEKERDKQRQEKGVERAMMMVSVQQSQQVV